MQTVAQRRIAPTRSHGGPRALAALRIAAGLAALIYVGENMGFVLPPEGLWFPPPGTAWLDFLPATLLLFGAAMVVLAVSAAAVVVGWRPRWTASIAAVAFFYAGWVTTLTSKVDHSHHVLWVLVIVAVSPAANVWAIRREDRPGSYSWPIMAVMVLIGLIYFGAGLQKLTTAGLAWGWSDNLANTMLNMAWEKNQPVHQWLLDWPLIGRVMGTGALLFELTFLPLMLHPKTRRSWPLGLVFHWGTWWILGIPFLTLQVLYLAFLPWDRQPVERETSDVQRRVIAGLVAVVAVFSVAGAYLWGADRAWPVAAYPGFAGFSGHYVTDIEVYADGKMTYITDHPVADQVGRQRILWLAERGAVLNKPVLLEWLDADRVETVRIDTSRT